MYMNKSYIIVYIQLVRHLMSCPEIITLVIDVSWLAYVTLCVLKLYIDTVVKNFFVLDKNVSNWAVLADCGKLYPST